MALESPVRHGWICRPLVLVIRRHILGKFGGDLGRNSCIKSANVNLKHQVRNLLSYIKPSLKVLEPKGTGSYIMNRRPRASETLSAKPNPASGHFYDSRRADGIHGSCSARTHSGFRVRV